MDREVRQVENGGVLCPFVFTSEMSAALSEEVWEKLLSTQTRLFLYDNKSSLCGY